MADSHKNLAVTTVLTAPSPATSGTSLVLASGGGALMPDVPFTGTVWPASGGLGPSTAELVRVTAKSTDTLTIEREAEGSTARSILTGDNFAATVTAAQMVTAERSVEITVSQSSHGFAVGDVLRISDEDEYDLAQADSVENAEVAGVVSGTPSADTFVLTVSGHVTGLSGLTPGAVHYLDPDTPGALTDVEPTTEGDVSKPLVQALNETDGFFFNWRGVLLTNEFSDAEALFLWTVTR